MRNPAASKSNSAAQLKPAAGAQPGHSEHADTAGERPVNQAGAGARPRRRHPEQDLQTHEAAAALQAQPPSPQELISEEGSIAARPGAAAEISAQPAAAQLELFEALDWPALTQRLPGSLLADASGAALPSASMPGAAGPAAAGASGASAAAGISGSTLLGLGALAAVGAAAAASHSSAPAPAPAPAPPADTRAPSLQSISASASADTISLQYDEALSGTQVPTAGQFTVVQAGQTLAVSALSLAGTVITLKLAGDLKAGAFSLAYRDSTTGNDTSAIQDASGNDAASLLRGIAADGYLLGASIYIDANGDGIAQAHEDTGIKTGTDGSFVLSDVPAGKGLLAVGGINTDTGIANTLTLSSPAGSGVINPLTTLMQEMIAAGTLGGSTPEQRISLASAQLALALGLSLPADGDFSRYDPLADASAAGLAAQKIAAQLAVLTELASGDVSAQHALIKALAADLANDTVAAPLATAGRIAAALTAAGIAGTNSLELAQALGRLATSNSFQALSKAQSQELGLGLASGGGGAPSALIGAAKLHLKAGEQTLLAFSFSEAVTGFDLGDVSISGAQLSDLTALAGGRSYSATLTTLPSTHGAITVALGAGSYTNAAGVAGSAAIGPAALSADNRAPLAEITLQTQPLGVGQSSRVTFSFDEPLSFFDTSQVKALKGSLANFQALDSRSYTATFTPTDGLQSTMALIELPASAYADTAGIAGIATGIGFTVDTLPPILSISSDKASLKLGETAALTLRFSEPVKGLSTEDFATAGRGIVSNFQTIDSRTYSATFTPADNLAGEAPISLAADAYRDLVGNAGIGEIGLSLRVDNLRPSLSISSTASTLIAGQSATLTFTFDEAVTGFEAADVALTNGSLSAWNAATGAQAGKVYTATFTPTADFAGPSGSVNVATNAYTDLAGNAPAAASNLSLVIDTRAPQVLSISADGASDTITITFDSVLKAEQLPATSAFQISQGNATLNAGALSLGSNVLTLSGIAGLNSGPFNLSYAPPQGQARLQDLRGNAVAPIVQLIVADGYIRGAKIYIDTNNDGIAQDSEFTGVSTGLDGSVVMPAGVATGTILAVGGINNDTGIANTMTLAAPAGSLVINPLTTLVQQVARDSGGDASAARIKVSRALGLDETLDLTRFDPLANPGSASALAVQKAAAKVATLAASVGDAQADLVQALAQTIVQLASQPSPTVLQLSEPATLQSLLGKAGLSVSSEQLQSLQTDLGTIASAQSLGQISQAQSVALDSVAPAAPVIKMVLPSSMGEPASATVSLPIGAKDGSAATAGDVLTLSLAGGGSMVHTLTLADIKAGHVSLVLPATMIDAQGSALSARLTDQAGHQSPTATLADAGSDTLNLANTLGPTMKMALQSLASQDLPVIGSLEEMISMIWEQMQSDLAGVPLGKLSPVASGGGARPAGGVNTSSDYGEGSDLYALMFDEVPPATNSGSGSGSAVIPAESDPFKELPVYDNSQDYPAPPSPSTPTSYSKPLVGRNTGAQYYPEDVPFWPNALNYNAQTGEFVLKYSKSFQVVDLPMLGQIGDEGLQAKIDANLGGYLTFSCDLQGKLDAQKFMVLDTTKSKVELYTNLGVSEGSMIGGQLGPLTIIGTDVESQYATKDAKRKNTGIEASATVYLKDYDEKSDDRLTLDAKTLGKFTNAIKNGTFSTGTYFDLIVDVEGRLSTQLLGQIDLNLPLEKLDTSALIDLFGLPTSWKTTTNKIDGFIDQVDSLLGIFNPQVSTVLTVPVDYVYDSRDSARNKTVYQTIHMDDVAVGLDTLITQIMGPGIEMLDTVMAPLYWVEDLMNTQLPPLGRVDLLMDPADYDWPEVAEDIVMTVANSPVTLVNGLLDEVEDAMDRNKDGSITVFEGMRGMVDLYQEMALSIKSFWDKLNSDGGEIVMDAVTAAFTAVGVPIGTFTSILDTIAQSVTAPGQGQLSPIDQVQFALDITERVLNGIDQLQSLSEQYEAALYQMNALDAAGQGSALSLPLGNYAFNITSGQFSQSRGAFEAKGPGYVPPPGSDPFVNVSQKEAIQKIYKEVTAGTISSASVSVGLFQKAGLDFSTVEAYKGLGFAGVDEGNFAAMIDLLKTRRSSIFDSGKNWGDDSVVDKNADGVIDASMGSFAAEFEELIHYGRVLNLVNGQPDFPGWKLGTWGESLYELTKEPARTKKEVWVDRDGAVVNKDSPFAYKLSKLATDYDYGGTSASALLKRMITGMKESELDSASDLDELWKVLTRWEDLMSNKTVHPTIRAHGGGDDDPEEDELVEFYPTFKELETLGLPINSRDDGLRKEIGYHILETPYDDDWDEPEEFEEIYDEVSEMITDANKAYDAQTGTANAAQKDVLKKVMDLADNTGTSLTQTDLLALGISTLGSDWLTLLNEVIKSTYDGSQVNTLSKFKAVVNAVAQFATVVNDQDLDDKDFYRAMEKLLGTKSVEDLEHVLRANTGSAEVTYSTFTLPPLVEGVFKARSRDQVDTLDEVQKIFNITEKITRLTMADERLFDNSKNYYNVADRDDDKDKKYYNYDQKLSPEDMALIGFNDFTATELNDGNGGGLIPALKNYNYTGTYYDFPAHRWKSGGSIYKTIPSLAGPMTLDIFSRLADETTQIGFFGDLLKEMPWLKDIYLSARKNGFEFPFLNDSALIQKLWLGQPVDLFTFDPPFRQWLTEASGGVKANTGVDLKAAMNALSSPIELFNVDLLAMGLKAAGVPTGVLDAILPVQIPLKGVFEASIVPRLSFGADTGGLVQWWNTDYSADGSTLGDIGQGVVDLLNGFYIRDSYMQGGGLVDLPELEMNMSLLGQLGIQVGKPNYIVDAQANLTAGFDLKLAMDLNNADIYGKVRLSDMVGQLFSDPLEVLDVKAALDFFLKAQAGASIDFSPDKGELSTTMSLLASAASAFSEFFYDTDQFKWGPYETGKAWPIIDENPDTTAPSLSELLGRVIG